MHPEIDRLIEIAITEGEISEKARSIILRKADSLGLDKDEVEMILDGELALMKKEQQKGNQIPPKSNKEGELKKCPSCGAPVPSFTTKCNDCGHEFRYRNSSASISDLFQLLIKVESEERGKSDPKGSGIMGAFLAYDQKNQMEASVARRIASTIASFPIPTTKEDILEFLTQAVSKAEVKGVFQIPNGLERNYYNTIAQAWNNKCVEIIMKARFSMNDNKETLQAIEVYAKQLKIK